MTSELFMQTGYQDQLVDLWVSIARRYKDEATVAVMICSMNVARARARR
jgi:hypothetical protein